MDRATVYKATKLRNEIIEFLVNWGVDKDSISVGDQLNYYENAHKEIIHAEVDNIAFRISLRVRAVRQEYGKHSKFYKYEHYWDLSFVFGVANSYQLSFTIELETFWSGVEKVFGKRDLEVYNTLFDKTFYLSGNHKYAHVDIFTEELQQMLLGAAATQSFPKIIVGTQGIVIGEKLDFINIPHILKRTERFLGIGLLLSKNIANWSPPA